MDRRRCGFVGYLLCFLCPLSVRFDFEATRNRARARERTTRSFGLGARPEYGDESNILTVSRHAACLRTRPTWQDRQTFARLNYAQRAAIFGGGGGAGGSALVPTRVYRWLFHRLVLLQTAAVAAWYTCRQAMEIATAFPWQV